MKPEKNAITCVHLQEDTCRLMCLSASAAGSKVWNSVRARNRQITARQSRGKDPGSWGRLFTPCKYVGRVRVCFDPPECHILSFKTVVG